MWRCSTNDSIQKPDGSRVIRVKTKLNDRRNLFILVIFIALLT